jgi:hypothetical protein
VANATKHNILTRRNPKLSSAKQIEERLLFTEFAGNQGSYWDVEKVIVLKLDDGGEQELLPLLTSVLNMWGAFCFKRVF